VQAAEARLGIAQANVEVARLRLQRMTVRAPQAGRVLALAARPGMRVMGLAPGSLHDSSTVVTMYDPQSLQVRADVPLDQVGRVQPGQAVRIESEAVPGAVLDGEVLFKTAQADVQKNTLQVKVAITSPPPDLKTDVLVRLTFLAPPGPQAREQDGEQLRLLVPRQLIESGEGGARVWVADQVNNVARSRPVKLGSVSRDELVEVSEGLADTDRLICGGREGLKDGDRIVVTGEDAAQGVAPVGERMRAGEATQTRK
jgi:RND family efflux transporter MFP subunit